MNDYQLERLNTRSFEQLVQALALQEFGSQVSVFGDGPDGGREAAFFGAVDYPKGRRSTCWKGHGMFQAKFRQQPGARASDNTRWALNELKAEFSKLAPRPKSEAEADAHVAAGRRVCPSYYVFATNLALSPALKSGGKDSVRTFLESCRKSHGLKDFAIWDGDQIRRLLDAHDGIRTSFLPFILPADVLAAVMQNLTFRRPEFAQVMLRYLQHELMNDLGAKLSEAGSTKGTSVSLASVFVDLPIEGSALPSADAKAADEVPVRYTVLKALFADADYVLRPSFRSQSQAGGKRPETLRGRFVLIGGPGQGKTTAGVFACQIMRASLLRDAGLVYDREVEQALFAIESEAKNLPRLHARRYPLRIDLKKLAESLANQTANSLIEFLTLQIAKLTTAKVDAEDFRLWLRRYPWLLVLDGLDEVPASSNRTLMLEAIQDFVRIEAHQADADLLVVATTRPQGYSDEFDPNHYAHLTLLPLRPEEALKYGSRLVQARRPGNAAEAEQLIEKLALATRNPATVRLMESPLQVTIMQLLIELGGTPPEQRWKLFKQYYDTIFKREKERGTPFSRLLQDHEPDIHWIHSRAGWLLQKRNAEAGKTSARLSHAEFDALVRDRLVSLGFRDKELATLVGQLRQAATDRLVLLVGNTEHEIGFEIRSLQEFMAAEHVFSGTEEAVVTTLRDIAPHPYWRNVFLFMAGRIFQEHQRLVDSVIALCDHLNEPHNDAVAAQVSSGSRLALALLVDDACRRQPAHVRRLARLAARIMDTALTDEYWVLSSLFSREAGPVLKEELQSRVKDAAFAWGAWLVAFDLANVGVQWAQELVTREFPWSHRGVTELLSLLHAGPRTLGHFVMGQIARNLRHVGVGLVARLSRSGALKGQIDDGVERAIAHALLDSKFIDLTARDGSRLPHQLRLTTAPIGLRMQAEDFSCAHPHWRLMAAAECFGEHPTPENLASRLDLLLELSTESTHYWLPWQFNLCIQAANTGNSASQIAQTVLRGAIGSSEDWRRWSEMDRISLQSLRQEAALLSASDSVLGSLFCGKGWGFAHGTGVDMTTFVDEVSLALQELLPQGGCGGVLIELACLSLRETSSRAHEASLRSFVKATSRHKHHVGLDIALAILCSRLPLDDKLDMLVSLGERVNGNSLHTFLKHEQEKNLPKVWTDFYDHARASGRELEVLDVLSQLWPGSHMHRVSSDVLERMEANSRTQRAATRIRLITLNWIESETEVASKLLELGEVSPRWTHAWMTYIDTASLHGSQLEALLLKVLRQATSEQLEKYGRRWQQLLSKLVDRRPAPTTLLDPC